MNILIFLFVLSILVVVHEWGHFITARALGVGVEKFSVGFGPKIFSRKRKGTEFMLSAIPLGGYVKLSGDERSECKGLPGEFYSHPVGHRVLIVLMGPVVNFVFAFFSLMVIFMAGFPGGSTKIISLTPGGAAQTAGLRKGDTILAVNSRKIYGAENLQRLLRAKRPRPLDLQVQRGEQVLSVQVQAPLVEGRDELGDKEKDYDLGVAFLSNAVGWVSEGSPAQKAGIKEGDKVVEIDGFSIQDWPGLQKNIRESKGEFVLLVVARDGRHFTFNVTPKIDTVKGDDGQEEQQRMIGVGPVQEINAFRFGPKDAFFNAGSEMANIIILTLKALGKVATGSMSAKSAIGGPIRIFSVVTAAAAMGIVSLIYVMAVISASLGLFNLFPVPVLDGGHIFLLAIEKLRGRPLSVKIEETLNKLGLTLLMLLMAFVIFNDIVEVGWWQKLSDITAYLRK